MPFKHNASRRHRIGKMKFKVTNWAEYEAGLRRRGSLTLWMTPEALSSWQAPKRTTRGGQPRYSDLAIETALTLGLVFGLGLRQTEGPLISVLKLMSLDLAVPDHTTLSRRASKRRLPNKRQYDRDRIPEKGAVHVLAAINTDGRMKWQVATGYGKRSLVETAIGRYKSIIGHRLRARSFAAQRTEVAIGCTVLNRMLACARPKSVRCKTATP